MRLRRFLLVCFLLLGGVPALAGTVVAPFDGRDEIVHVPARLPPAGRRALVIVLHGGFGSAETLEGRRAEQALNLDAAADRLGFVVAYLNGTPVARLLPATMRGWNAGECCGLPVTSGVDDVGYLRAAVGDLVGRYGIDPRRVFGMGHSNGAMMVQRLLCQTDLLAAGVAISGPLDMNVSRCPDARGRRVLAIHGADDQNVPVAGGRGVFSVAGVAFLSEDHARQVFAASGGTYDLRIVPGAGHILETLDSAFQLQTGESIDTASMRFFGLGG
jgi:polyhydroxybutyrate depolymerase